jgi:bacterioferritin (cytochrome b1)
MRLKIDVTGRERKNLKFEREVNEAWAKTITAVSHVNMYVTNSGGSRDIFKQEQHVEW